MRGRHLTRHWPVTALGVVLCLLAAVFAIEAKVAWFSPDGSATAQLSATKLQPADAPKLIAQALAPTGAVPPVVPESSLLLILALFVAAMVFLPATARMGREISASQSFSPALFFRPPPQY